MRQRLSWGKKEADMSKKADPYTMNQDHANNPVKKYDVGGPAEFGETPDMKTPWTSEGRNEVGLPAPERAAVQAARKLEDKALKCITIAQRVLPGASDDMIEKQATDLMHLPDQAIIATLQRQAEYAEMLAAQAKKDDEDDDDEGKEAKSQNDPNPQKGTKAPEAPKEEVEAAKKPEEEKKPEMKEEVEAAKKPAEEEKKPEMKEEVEAAKKPAEEEKKPEMEEVEASSDLLDQIFADTTPKTGAKKLSGIVKQASSDSISLDNLWNAPPDVSKAFR